MIFSHLNNQSDVCPDVNDICLQFIYQHTRLHDSIILVKVLQPKNKISITVISVSIRIIADEANRLSESEYCHIQKFLEEYYGRHFATSGKCIQIYKFYTISILWKILPRTLYLKHKKIGLDHQTKQFGDLLDFTLFSFVFNSFPFRCLQAKSFPS